MMTPNLAPILIFSIFFSVSSATVEKKAKLLVPDVMQSTRIVGGEAAKRGEFRGQVSLQNRFRSHVCGGTLINGKHVITAAHCYQSRNIIVYVMGDDLVVSKVGSNTRQLRTIENFVIHPKYDQDTLDSDIAIIRVDAPFVRSAFFSPILRAIETPKVGQLCQAVGWGTTSYDTDTGSVQLLKVNVEIFNQTFCNSDDSYDGIITSTMFCAGDKRGKHDACQGDSGGLLTCDANTLTGVISFGYECGLSDFPGVYTDVSKFNKWINETITNRTLPAYEYGLNSTTIKPTDEPTTPTPPPNTIKPQENASTVVAPMIILTFSAAMVWHFLI